MKDKTTPYGMVLKNGVVSVMACSKGLPKWLAPAGFYPDSQN